MNMNSDASKNWINSCTAGNLKMTKNETFLVVFKPLWKSWRWQMHRCISYFCAKTNTTRKPTEQKIKKLTQQAQLGSFSYFCFWVSNKHTCAIFNWNSVVISNVQIFSAILKIISSNLPNIKERKLEMIIFHLSKKVWNTCTFIWYVSFSALLWKQEVPGVCEIPVTMTN